VADKKKKSTIVAPAIPMSIPTGEKTAMVDVHAVQDRRGVAINRVGVSPVKFPLIVRTQSGKKQETLGVFELYGSLPKEVKGTNMSRFVEVLLENRKQPLSGDNFQQLLHQLKTKLGNSNDVYISASFNYFMTKLTPATKREHIVGYPCKFIGNLIHGQYYFTVQTTVDVAAYCPCSKEMCLVDKEKDIGRGAHAQRSTIELQVRTNPPQPGLWIEDMVHMCETSGSAELYPLLKRPDEKFVTEQGYGNPKYVEDIARDVMLKVKALKEAQWARISVTNAESIHPHDVEAIVEMSKKGGRWFSTNRGHM
jgi:GTP cyclohydrolase I